MDKEFPYAAFVDFVVELWPMPESAEEVMCR